MKKRKAVESHSKNKKKKKKMCDMHFCATGTPSLFEISGGIFTLSLVF